MSETNLQVVLKGFARDYVESEIPLVLQSSCKVILNERTEVEEEEADRGVIIYCAQGTEARGIVLVQQDQSTALYI